MEKQTFLKKSPLFYGIGDKEAMLRRLSGGEQVYERGERILSAGKICERIGVILEGSADVVREDAEGVPVTVARIAEGEFFAEAFACSGRALAVSVEAAVRSKVLWISVCRLFESGGSEILANFLRVFAQKNVFLTERIGHLSRHSLREKVISYLHGVARSAGSATFQIPFDRQGLADYLGCDRSALSAMLSRLKREGVLDYYKNSFRFTEKLG